MANVILGLLLLSPMSLYALGKAFESGISMFYSGSIGSIKRALDGLLAEGSIEVADAEPGPRGKKTYAITPAGRERFDAWLFAEVDDSDAEAGSLARLYFLGFAPRERRVEVLEAIRRRAVVDLAELEGLARVIGEQPVPPEFDELARYGTATLEAGLHAQRAKLEWIDGFLAEERELRDRRPE